MTLWRGTGRVENSGDSQRFALYEGEYMESEVVELGGTGVVLRQNDYNSGDEGLLKYRHGATPQDCITSDWTIYIGPFVSLGYVQIRLESTLGFSPEDLSPVLWLDASSADNFSLTGSDVDVWYDISGYNHHAYPLDANKPTYNESGFVYIGPAGYNKRLRVQNLENPASFDVGISVFVVYKRVGTWVSYPALLCKGNINSQWQFQRINTTDKMYWANGSVQAISTTSLGTSVFRLIEGLASSANEFRQWFSGNAEGVSAPASDAGSSTDLYIGGSNSTNNGIVGNISEIIVINSELSQTNREKMEGYLCHKWGIEGQLPAIHTYKSSPP